MAIGFAAGPPTGRPVSDDLTEAEWLTAVWIAAGLTAAAPADFTGADELLTLAGFPFSGKIGGTIFTIGGVGGS